MTGDNEFNSESVLVKALSEGKILAFNTLFRKYSSRLYGFALGYLKSESEAEELVQEVFTIVWAKRAELKKDLCFKSFLFTIAFNIIRKLFRSRLYHSEYLKSEFRDESDMQTTGTVTSNSLQQYIISLVEKMPEKRKQIFIKSRFEGLSIKEISEEYGISHKTVENQISVALRFLRENLKKEDITAGLFLLIFLS